MEVQAQGERVGATSKITGDGDVRLTVKNTCLWPETKKGKIIFTRWGQLQAVVHFFK